jgi:SagB-type dehydrogenase family enzyme
MVSRFARSFWKYRRHAKAYRNLVLDAGHLSQTFYLVCTALGLGPFFTTAINEIQILNELRLSALQVGVIGLCGCGVISE